MLHDLTKVLLHTQVLIRYFLNTLLLTFSTTLVPFASVIPHFLNDYFLFTRLLNPFYPIILSTFYSLFPSILPVYFPTFYLFKYRHYIYLFCKHFTRLFLSFYPFKSQLFYQHFICLFFHIPLLFSRFTRLLKLRSFVVSDEISAERYFRIPHFGFRKGHF